MKPYENPRWRFVDGMRGIAALAVLGRHLVFNGPLADPLTAILPAPLLFFCRHGGCGVEIFFVISGFVIAHSLRDNPLTAPEVGNFIVRRQLRLDLPYWAMLAFVLVLQVARNLVPGTAPTPSSSGGVILANAFYLHRIACVEHLLIVSWTLCLEIQFYLFFILLLASGRFLRGGRRSLPLEAAMMLVTGLVSIGLASGTDPYSNLATTWFPYPWFSFAGGVLCYHSVRDRRYDAAFAIFIAGFAVAFSRGDRWEPNVLAGLLTILTFWGVGKAGKLTTWLSQDVFQYFGRISYSLYLVHFPITLRFLRAAERLTGENQAMALVWFVMACAFSILVAHVFHHAVERPSMRLAARFKRSVPGGGPVIAEPTPSRPTSPIPALIVSRRAGGVNPLSCSRIEDRGLTPPARQDSHHSHETHFLGRAASSRVYNG